MKRSLRKANWDYSSDAIYMVTTVVNKRKPFFGEIFSGEVVLSEAGKTVEEEWLNIQVVFRNIEIGEYVVMPDHFHGILRIESTNSGEATKENCFGPQRENLAAVMRKFKSSSSFQIKKSISEFKWQIGYQDIILSSDRAIENAREYIRNNPHGKGR